MAYGLWGLLTLSFYLIYQQFEVKDWPVEDYGEFFDGDSYIILNVSKMVSKFLHCK